MPGGPAGAAGARCLGERVTAYADRAMDPASLLHWDRHLVTCEVCRAAVDEERRVLSSLRADPGATPMPTDLRSLLLAMAAEQCPSTPERASRDRRTVPPVPRPVAPMSFSPVPVVHRAAPALHRSARRATVFAGLAAGATAAAAWTVAVSGAATTGTTAATTSVPRVSPVAQRTRVPSSYAPAVFTVQRSALGVTVTSVHGSAVPPGASTMRPGSAESTP